MHCPNIGVLLGFLVGVCKFLGIKRQLPEKISAPPAASMAIDAEIDIYRESSQWLSRQMYVKAFLLRYLLNAP